MPMRVAEGDPIEKGPYLGRTFEDQRILIDCEVLDQIFEAAMWSGHWKCSGLGLGMAFGIVMGWGIELSLM